MVVIMTLHLISNDQQFVLLSCHSCIWQSSAKDCIVCHCLGLCHTSKSTLNCHQKNAIAPTVGSLQKAEQEKVAKEAPQGCLLMGDGCADQPGHTVKYLVYTFIEGSSSKVLHMQFADKRQVCFVFL